jgi:L-methionine (R)-S-oxide reductase
MASLVFGEIVEAIEGFAAGTTNVVALQRFVVDTIAGRLPAYNWVGFYMLDPDDPSALVVGEYHGAATEHVRIPVTEGICGAAVASGETVVIDDVSSDPRYLACSIETRSEIVAPIRVSGEIVGEIDIDSHELAAFGVDDRRFVEDCAAVVGRFMERTR